MNVLLCGMPMSGKTTYGQLLAQALQWKWVDTDQQLEGAYARQYGRHLTAREITCHHGRDFFQQIERQALESLVSTNQYVISLGGNAIHSLENRQLVKRLGMVLFLKVPLATIMLRILSQRDLPSYVDPKKPADSIRELESIRAGLYAEVAQATLYVESNSTCEEIVSQMLHLLKEKIHGL